MTSNLAQAIEIAITNCIYNGEGAAKLPTGENVYAFWANNKQDIDVTLTDKHGHVCMTYTEKSPHV